MIVCICRAVSQHMIRSTIAKGASSVEEIGAACRAGTGCGACHEVIDRMLKECPVSEGTERPQRAA